MMKILVLFFNISIFFIRFKIKNKNNSNNFLKYLNKNTKRKLFIGLAVNAANTLAKIQEEKEREDDRLEQERKRKELDEKENIYTEVKNEFELQDSTKIINNVNILLDQTYQWIKEKLIEIDSVLDQNFIRLKNNF